jgi:hypothetical protein
MSAKLNQKEMKGGKITLANPDRRNIRLLLWSLSYMEYLTLQDILEIQKEVERGPTVSSPSSSSSETVGNKIDTLLKKKKPPKKPEILGIPLYCKLKETSGTTYTELSKKIYVFLKIGSESMQKIATHFDNAFGIKTNINNIKVVHIYDDATALKREEEEAAQAPEPEPEPEPEPDAAPPVAPVAKEYTLQGEDRIDIPLNTEITKMGFGVNKNEFIFVHGNIDDHLTGKIIVDISANTFTIDTDGAKTEYTLSNRADPRTETNLAKAYKEIKDSQNKHNVILLFAREYFNKMANNPPFTGGNSTYIFSIDNNPDINTIYDEIIATVQPAATKAAADAQAAANLTAQQIQAVADAKAAVVIQMNDRGINIIHESEYVGPVFCKISEESDYEPIYGIIYDRTITNKTLIFYDQSGTEVARLTNPNTVANGKTTKTGWRPKSLIVSISSSSPSKTIQLKFEGKEIGGKSARKRFRTRLTDNTDINYDDNKVNVWGGSPMYGGTSTPVIIKYKVITGGQKYDQYINIAHQINGNTVQYLPTTFLMKHHIKATPFPLLYDLTNGSVYIMKDVDKIAYDTERAIEEQVHVGGSSSKVHTGGRGGKYVMVNGRKRYI